MSVFTNRIGRLRARLGPDVPPVVLVYADGERRTVGALEAIEMVTGNPEGIVAVEHQDGSRGNGLLDKLLTGLLECGDKFADVPELGEMKKK